ncbi:unnamed protein product [Rotaria magnacalcarata]
MATAQGYRTDDDDDTYSSSAFANINEKDFYKLLNVNPNATKEQIRQAYFRRAREFHPDKNTTADTTRVFQSMKLAYETLSDEKRRMEYDADTDLDKNNEDDDNNDDEIFSTSKTNQMKLHMGEKISDIYRQRIDRYVVEYTSLSFSNNFNEKLIEIIRRAATDASIDIDTVDTYIQCNVCRQSCLNRQAHERENREPYERLFNDQMKLITLEEIIDRDLWNWQAVEKTSTYLSLWNAHDEWNQVPDLIEQLKNSIEIICKPERYWTLFIDKFEQDKVELMKLPALLSKTVIIDYLPKIDEIEQLKTIFDRYDQEEQRGLFSKIQNNDQRTTSGYYYLFEHTTITTNKYIDRNDFYHPIENPPPNEIVSDHCQNCRKTFSLFTRRHYCRMCGHQHCADCLLSKRIPHLGYITIPVKICRRCSDEKKTLIYQHLFTYVKLLTEKNRTKYLSEYLALLYLYEDSENQSFYQKTGEYYYELGKYSLALQCFTYAQINSDTYLAYSIELYTKKEYSYAFTCMVLCQKTARFWLEQAVLQDSSVYALLCYECAKLIPEQIFEIATQKSSDDNDTCLLYLLYLHVKYTGDNRIRWEELGEKLLFHTKYDGSLAIFCFYLYGKMQVNGWIQIGEQLAGRKQFDKLAHLLSYLYHVLRIDILASTNSYIYFLTKILLSSNITLSLDDWLTDICKTPTSNVNRIVIGLVMCHLYKYTLWVEYKNQHVDQKEYYRALLCHKMAEYINGNNDSEWFINSIENFDPVGYELLDGVRYPYNWEQLGDQYFNTGKFKVALNCYLFCESTKVDQIILQKAQSPSLQLSIALLYSIVVYKRLRINSIQILSKKNSTLCNNTVYSICLLLSQQNNRNVCALILSAIKMYETDNIFKDTELFKYHLLLVNELVKLTKKTNDIDRLINGGAHILLTFENLSNESIRNLIELSQSYLIKLNVRIFDILKSATYKSCRELMEILLNPSNYFREQLKQLFQQCLGRLQLSEIQPSEYRSKLYLIQAIIFKLENDAEKSLRSAHDALLSHPYDDVIDSLILFMNHSHFHSTLRQTLLNDIKQCSLTLTDLTPPTHMMNNLTFLNRTERLIMLKKYERAIFKRLAENDPVQAAYSYMDLIMAVTSSRTLFMNNLIMSCVYFFQAMSQPKCTLAEVYAYRSIIFDISVEIFLFTRHYLPLYVQMYAYKLLYTLIMRSTDLFAKRIISSSSKRTVRNQPILSDFHETLLDELLKNILQLSKVSPFTHMPTIGLSHDMIYMECAGNEFLSKYLKSMAPNSSMYQYYFFEGIWKSWIDGENFEDERDYCMYYLLKDRQWTTYDVEDLLCWSIIPRTDDGWYLDTKHQLQLDPSGYSQVIGITLNNDTGDIEFMFAQAKKNEHNLFDAGDVMDIVTNGISYAYFTLDPPNVEYHSHPFNEMKYLPKRLVNIPNYLLTLLHTDYLLKMISTGVEICSQTPFEMRPTSENLMQRLPVHIREELQSIVKKKSGLLTNSIHRFWIQPESEIEYEQAYYRNFFGRTNENITQFYLSDKIKMCVKKHRMKYDEKGNLIDDKDDNENDESAEAEFARVFTKYYDEIGEYFPELLRLKELLKLSVLSRIIQSRYESQCDLAAQIENDTTFETYLTEVKNKIGNYPTGSVEADEKTLNAISNNICKNFFCKKSNLKPYLFDWLRHGQHKALVTFVKQSLIQCKAKLKFTIEKFRLHYDDEDHDDEQRLNNDTTQCFWVPAAFSSDLSMKVYGGVILTPNPKVRTGVKNESEKSKKSKTTENVAKLSKKSKDIKSKRCARNVEKSEDSKKNCQTTDQNGNIKTKSHVIGRGAGPSGDPKIHSIQFNSKKGAMEAAKKDGKENRPIHHGVNYEKKEPAHWHPADKDGKIIKNGKHYTYGRYSKT